MLEQIRWGELVLVAEQAVVHLPEAALGAGRLRGLRRELRARMHVDQRNMPEDVAELVAEPLPQLLDDPGDPTTEGAFEVAVLDQTQRRVRGPAEMIPRRVDRRIEQPRPGGPVRWAPPVGDAEQQPADEGGQQRAGEHADACPVGQHRLVKGKVNDK